ncbi:hypothetical protein CLF_103386 [Clonorchis sinensis]|uniref:Uncharacterized protein n=1 Tax=Clonorchis sinensis TaxID=79923 RepID=G7Y9N8_CLOSI|nr:hypothetical protein CLF_103386 [Clonorchis sinensis]
MAIGLFRVVRDLLRITLVFPCFYSLSKSSFIGAVTCAFHLDLQTTPCRLFCRKSTLIGSLSVHLTALFKIIKKFFHRLSNFYDIGPSANLKIFTELSYNGYESSQVKTYDPSACSSLSMPDRAVRRPLPLSPTSTTCTVITATDNSKSSFKLRRGIDFLGLRILYCIQAGKRPYFSSIFMPNSRLNFSERNKGIRVHARRSNFQKLELRQFFTDKDYSRTYQGVITGESLQVENSFFTKEYFPQSDRWFQNVSSTLCNVFTTKVIEIAKYHSCQVCRRWPYTWYFRVNKELYVKLRYYHEQNPSFTRDDRYLTKTLNLQAHVP